MPRKIVMPDTPLFRFIEKHPKATIGDMARRIEDLENAIMRLKPHIWERYMEGESDYERAVIALLNLVKENYS